MAKYVWRIATDTPHYSADDLSGKGAEKTGGRWNRKGMPLLYGSSSIALACLETLVHLAGGDPLPLNRYLVRVSVSPTAWRKRAVFDQSAHVGWDAEPPGLVSMDWGTQWASAGSSLLAEVPSVVVPEETNILINPAYKGARRLAVTKMRQWRYDLRLQDEPRCASARNVIAEISTAPESARSWRAASLCVTAAFATRDPSAEPQTRER